MTDTDKDDAIRLLLAQAAALRDQLAAQGRLVREELVKREQAERELHDEAKEHARAEEALRASKRIIQGIMDAVPARVFWKDKNLVYLGCNATFARDAGFDDSKDVIGKDDFQLSWREQAELYRGDDREVIESGCPKLLIEEPQITPDGRTLALLTNKVPLLNAAGEIIGVLGTYMDITDRKRAAEAVRESDERYRNLVETCGDAVWEVNEQGIYTYASPKLRDILGYEPEELVGKSSFALMPPEEAARVVGLFNEYVPVRKSFLNFQSVNLHKDGHRVVLETNAVPFFDAQGAFRGFRGTDRDVTQRKCTEEKLQQYAAELEQANEDVKQFAYIVSHDLRAPLVNLRGFAAELRGSLAALAPALDAALPHLGAQEGAAATEAMRRDMPEALGFIDSSVMRMDRLVNALLQLSRLGRATLHLEQIDSAATVEAVLKGLTHQTQKAQATVSVHALPKVVADATAMEQIFGNLLANAVLYLQPGRPGRIEVAGERSRTETTFHVRDNGRGIAQEDMPKVFAPFRRFGRQDVPGEGMGMAYVQTMVRRHGGRIRCQSELDVGTTFTFSIPHHTEAGGRADNESGA